MNAVLWVAQFLLALTFIWSAYMKLFNPDELPFPWVKNNLGLAKITGVVDLLAGLGLTLPGIFGIQPRLTIWAAYGTIILMLSAIVFHVSRGEAAQIGFNIGVVAIAIFIAWGRRNKTPI